MAPTLRARDLCFTAFQQDPPTMVPGTMSYLVYQQEVCPKTGRDHWQGYVEFKDAKTISAAQTLLGCLTAHMEKRKAKANDPAIEYCKKDETRKEGTDFKEFGEPKVMKGQGKRTDIDDFAEAVNAGASMEELYDDHAGIMLKYPQGVQKMLDFKIVKKPRLGQDEDMPECIWMYGPTGTGKTHRAFEDYNPDTDYVWQPDGEWGFDSYTNQSKVIINEFRGQINYANLLQMCDKFPFKVRRRGLAPTDFVAKKIIITSSMHPRDVYSKLAERDSLEQLCRRFTITEITHRSDQPPPQAPVFHPRTTAI